MLLLNSLTNDAFQQFVLSGIPGVQVSCTLSFRPRVQQWYIDITWGTFQLQGLAVVCAPNMLRQWRNIIPFGLACTNINFLDPYTIADFSDGNSSLYLLDSTDVTAVESEFFP